MEPKAAIHSVYHREVDTKHRPPTNGRNRYTTATAAPYPSFADPGAHVVRGGVEPVRRGPVVAPVRLPLELSVHAPLVHLVRQNSSDKMTN